MTTEYIKVNPGDLITAEAWNKMQEMVKADIAKQIKDAIQKVDNVPNANNAHKLENQTSEELTKDILEKARLELPKRTGYKMLFKRLVWDEKNAKGEEKVIKHDLDALPLVDVYQLDYFKVVCASDEEKYETWTNFYLYHTSEKKIRFTPTAGGTADTIEIEPKDGHPYKIAFSEMLSLYNVDYTDTTSLDDLVNEFWKAFFTDPNDEFDEAQFCCSPWFHKCCCDHRTVADLKRQGDWDDVWFQMRPSKNILYLLADSAPAEEQFRAADITAAPTATEVVHFDFKTVGMKLLFKPTYPKDIAATNINVLELPVMVLLKV